MVVLVQLTQTVVLVALTSTVLDVPLTTAVVFTPPVSTVMLTPPVSMYPAVYMVLPVLPSFTRARYASAMHRQPGARLAGSVLGMRSPVEHHESAMRRWSRLGLSARVTLLGPARRASLIPRRCRSSSSSCVSGLDGNCTWSTPLGLAQTA